MPKEAVLICISGQLTARFYAKIAQRIGELGEADSLALQVLFCCDGGELDGGVSLYHFFSKFRGDLTLYIASAKSAGAIAILGVTKKKMLPYGSVMFHAAVAKLGPLSNVQDLRAAIESTTSDDNQLRAIIRKHLPKITEVEWMKYGDGCFAPDKGRLIELGLFKPEDSCCDFPEGGCVMITPDLA